MSAKTESLKDIFLDIADETTLTQPQEEMYSHDPIEEHEAQVKEEISLFARDDGLDDAVDTDFSDAIAE